MEKVQNQVKDVSQFGTPDEHGNQAYWINFTDGSKGIFRTPNNDLFIPGQVAEYSIKEIKHSEKAGNYAILQRYKEPYEGEKKSFHGGPGSTNSNKSAEQVEQINRNVAIKAACELLAGTSNNTPERAIEAAEIFFDYINLGIRSKEPEQTSTPYVDPATGLPF
jgi:hypothetical protein